MTFGMTLWMGEASYLFFTAEGTFKSERGRYWRFDGRRWRPRKTLPRLLLELSGGDIVGDSKKGGTE